MRLHIYISIFRLPFDFKLSEVIENDTKEKVALTEEEEQALLSFIKTDNGAFLHHSVKCLNGFLAQWHVPYSAFGLRRFNVVALFLAFQ